jgi:hypothetical protein
MSRSKAALYLGLFEPISDALKMGFEGPVSSIPDRIFYTLLNKLVLLMIAIHEWANQALDFDGPTTDK